MTARILLADDHPMVCEGLRMMLEPTYRVVGMVHNGKEVLNAVRQLEPDLVLLDVSLPGYNGIEVLRDLSRAGVTTKVVMLTMHVEPLFADEAIRAGARGFLVKNATARDLLASIDQVLGGAVAVDARVQRKAETADPGWHPPPDADTAGDPLNALTERQHDVLVLVAKGHRNVEIAEQLGISTKAVEFHRTRLKRVLGVSNTAGLVRFAISRGLTGPQQGSEPPEA